MASAKVFISYCHADKDALEEVRVSLKSLERRGVITWWADPRLEMGDAWEEEIEKALDEATIAVLLISRRFLASDFIAEEEIPRILARNHAGQLTVLPVFLSASTVEDTPYSFTDPATGKKHQKKLSDFQGLGSLEKTLADLSWSDQQRAYADLERRLSKLAGIGSRPKTGAGPGPVKAEVEPLVETEYWLTAHLERHGDELRVSHSLVDGTEIGTVRRPWQEVERDAKQIAQTLDTNGFHVLESMCSEAPAGCGPALFRMVFGEDSDWEPILRAVFNKTESGLRPNPSYRGVCLRIATEIPLLDGLPWRLMAWQRQPLVQCGWILATTSTLRPDTHHTTPAPATVLVLDPQIGGGQFPPHTRHFDAVKELIGRAWPTEGRSSAVRRVTTRRGLVEALHTQRVELLYVYGRGSVDTGPPALLLEGGNKPDVLSLDELGQLIENAEHQPSVVYLNATSLCAPGSKTPGQILGPTVPVVIWRRIPEWNGESTTTALRWLDLWLAEGQDPVAAVNKLQPWQITRSVEAATLGVHSSHRTWRTEAFKPQEHARHPLLRLDRDYQKAIIAKHLRELVSSDSQRVMAVVAHGPAGNSIDALCSQLKHHLDIDVRNDAAVRVRRLEILLAGRDDLRTSLGQDLRVQLRAHPNETWDHLLRRHAPRHIDPGQRAVLWLDWGTFGADHQEALRLQQLTDWLRFAAEELTAACPGDLRIVSYLAIEQDSAVERALSSTLSQARRLPWARVPSFRMTTLDPLGAVSETHLLDFFEEPANTTCPPELWDEMTDLIMEATAGEFQAAVALLEEAERTSWVDMHQSLRRSLGRE